MKDKYVVSAFYFPNYHKGDKHNEAWHGKGWTEWEVLKNARPRFPGHDQPKIPLWGYEDEAEIPVMEKKIDAAADYGVNNLIFDWYWYEDGPFLYKPLDEAFLKAKNKDRVKFSLMWANHDWLEIQPVPSGYHDSQKLQLSGNISKEALFKAFDYIIENYFTQSNYFRLEGGLFFSIYEIQKFINVFGGIKQAQEGIKEIRRRVKEAGLGELHLNAVVWGITNLACESNLDVDGKTLIDWGFDSVTSYVWIHEHVIDFPTQDYESFRKICEGDFDRLTEKYKGLPYYPNITCGWDSSPRTCQSDMYENRGYPYTGVLKNNTAEEFKKGLKFIKEKLDNSDLKTKMFTINAWNEWTEGSYLEPDVKEGYAKLESIKEVFSDKE